MSLENAVDRYSPAQIDLQSNDYGDFALHLFGEQRYTVDNKFIEATNREAEMNKGSRMSAEIRVA